MNAVEATAAHLESLYAGARVVYRWAAPKGVALPPRYVVVAGTIGQGEATNFAGKHDQNSPVVWVTSVSRNEDPSRAADEVVWASQRARDSLLNWRPVIGRASFKPTHLADQPVQRDETLPDVVMFAVDQYGIQYQP